ncbi:MAG: hypothetical protein HZA37_02305 [Parcubacteria group bacterium]|nr:hypothetical protein [Parcubacteria group bacterium]
MTAEKITDVLKFYSLLKRPLTLPELRRALSENDEVSFLPMFEKLDGLVRSGAVFRSQGFYSAEPFDVSARKFQDILADKKWKVFLRRSRFFSLVPFVDFVLAGGSMCMGNVGSRSDFDVVIFVRRGRIFTVRFFAALVFGLFGYRRKRIMTHDEAADKICLNHFVTAASFGAGKNGNIYQRQLFGNLVPLCGSPDILRKFLGKERLNDLRFRPFGRFSPKNAVEAALSGTIGDWLEGALKKIQIWRIENSLKKEKTGYGPRFKYTDEELEFHPDNKIEAKLNGRHR